MRSLQVLILVLLATVASVPTIADTLTYSTTFVTYTDGDAAGPFDNNPFSLPGFNPSLGTLSEVSIQGAMSFYGLQIIGGEFGQIVAGSYDPSVQISMLAAPSDDNYFGDNIVNPFLMMTAAVPFAGPANTPGFPSLDVDWAAFLETDGSMTGGIDFAGNLTAFISSGPIWFEFLYQDGWNFTTNYDAHNWAVPGSYMQTITYTYERAAPVPEPPAILMLGAALVALGLTGRYFRRGAPQ